MGYQIKSGNTTRVLLFTLIQSSDHLTGLTGVTPTVTLSKNGGAFASPSGAVSEVGNGVYKVAANATDAGTLGPLALHASATGADPCDDIFEVVAYDPDDGNLALTGLNGLTAPTAGALITAGSGTAQLSTSSGNVTFSNTSIGSVTGAVGSVTGNVGGNVVGSVGSVVATVAANLTEILGTALTETSGYLAAAFKKFFNVAAPTSTMNEITLVDTVTTNTDMRGTDSAALAATALSTANWTNTRAGLIDHLDADISSRMATFTLPPRFSSLAVDASGYVTFNNSGVATETTIASAISALGTPQQSGSAVTLPSIPSGWITASGIAAGALDGRGDWLLSGSYVAPDNADIAAIKAKTDNLPSAPAATGDKMDLIDAPNATALTAAANALLSLADGIETGMTPKQAIRGIVAALFGKLTTAGQNPEVYQNPAGTAMRISVANDATGNRTSVTTSL